MPDFEGCALLSRDAHPQVIQVGFGAVQEVLRFVLRGSQQY